MPEELAVEAVAGHQGLCSKSWDQPPANVSDLPAECVEERLVECDNWIPWIDTSTGNFKH